MKLKTFRAVHQEARENAAEFCLACPNGTVITFSAPTRSLVQNSRLWALLTDVSAQVVWHGRKLSTEEWKWVFTAALKKQDVVPGINGGFVVLGQSTSQMSVAQMSELQELIAAFGAEHDVRWTEPAYEDVRA